MMTTSQFNSKLTELNIEFRKIVDSGNATEAFRWIATVSDFTRTLLEEACGMPAMTAAEKDTLELCGTANAVSRRNIFCHLTSRIKKEAALK